MFIKKRLFYPLSTIVFLISAWQGIFALKVWDPYIFPSPLDVLEAFRQLVSNNILLTYIVASLFRVTVGFYVASVLGISIGILLGRWKTGGDLFNGLIQFLRPISPLAWIPFALLWFGIGDGSAIFLIFISSFFPLLVSTVIAVKNIPELYYQAAANFSFNRWETLKWIILPAILPEIVTALRISLGIAWLVVVAAEMIAVNSGLGYLIIDSRNALRMDYVVVAMISIGVIGLIIDKAISQLQKPGFMRWKFEKK